MTGRRTTPRVPDPTDAEVEAAARAIAEESGDVVRYAPDGVDDHNRWSWVGIGDDSGHSEAFKDGFRDVARAALTAAREART